MDSKKDHFGHAVHILANIFPSQISCFARGSLLFHKQCTQAPCSFKSNYCTGSK